MGQKANPTSLRLGVNRTWDSRWYADEKYADYLLEDVKIKEFLKEKLVQAGISRIVIERPAKKARVTIHSARPGVVIGKKGCEKIVKLNLNEQEQELFNKSADAVRKTNNVLKEMNII